MLTHLTLKDFAVVSAVELSFGPGLTVVSGETGAGKSLLVDALMWLTGARADAGIVRHGAERAELSAEFHLDPTEPGLAWLREYELDEADTCTLRRVIRADGGSRSWINGRPATLAQLAELGGLLVEIHGQHEHQALLERGQQLALLDAYARHPALQAEVAEQSARWSSLDRQIVDLLREGDVGDRADFLEHQLRELAGETLDPADLERMLAAHRRQSHASALLQGFDSTLDRLTGDESLSVARALRSASNELAKLVEHEARLSEVATLLESAEIQVDEAASLLERLRDDLDLDPQHLQALETRLARLHDLARKHRVPIPELATRRDLLQGELEQLRGASDLLLALEQERLRAEADWRQVAAALSESRRAAAGRLGEASTSLMAELGMAGGVFVAQLEAIEQNRPQAQGAERVEFLVSANPGQPPRALRKVASGGELARISLAIEVATLGLDAVPTMVFDEVDSGIGGAVAEVVGQKLRSLGTGRQVLCVTHLPQVAAQGHHHFQVSKAINGRTTHSAVKALDEKARIEELARMLGGLEISKETRANARQMLAKAQSA